jgi:hypothetical protein
MIVRIMMSPTSVHAYQGMQRAFAEAARAAETIVSGFAAAETGAASKAGLRGDQVVRAMVDLTRAKTAAKANAKVLRTADEMTGSLLDILA